jgi:hypothetical protein
VLLPLLLVLVWLRGLEAAQTNAPPGNRFLLIVDTSKAMERRAGAVLQSVQDLFQNGLAPRLAAGDTLGVWTFNQQLFTGRFPLQHWWTTNGPEIQNRVLGFLREQKYENLSSLDSVLPALHGLIRQSPALNVILISDGSDAIRGTPFDEAINVVFNKWSATQRKANLPLLTLLSARNGSVADFSVSPAPWPLEWPAALAAKPATSAVPTSTEPAVSNLPPVAPAVVASAQATLPAPPVPQPQAADPAVPGVPLALGAASSNSARLVQAGNPSDQKPDPSAAPAVAPSAVKSDAPTSNPPPAPPAAPPEVKSAQLEPGTQAPAGADANKAPSNQSSDATPPTPVVSTTVKATVPSTVDREPPTPTTASSPVAISAPEPATSQTKPSRTDSSIPVVTQRLPPSAPTEVAQGGSLRPSRIGFLIGAVVLAVVGLGTFYFLRRRTSPSPHISLITQSFEREKKE